VLHGLVHANSHGGAHGSLHPSHGQGLSGPSIQPEGFPDCHWTAKRGISAFIYVYIRNMYICAQKTIIKAHMSLHYGKYARLWGSIHNVLAESSEMAHKLVKTSTRRTNWQVEPYINIYTYIYVDISTIYVYILHRETFQDSCWRTTSDEKK
jgi:hypothetical protein